MNTKSTENFVSMINWLQLENQFLMEMYVFIIAQYLPKRNVKIARYM